MNNALAKYPHWPRLVKNQVVILARIYIRYFNLPAAAIDFLLAKYPCTYPEALSGNENRDRNFDSLIFHSQ